MKSFMQQQKLSNMLSLYFVAGTMNCKSVDAFKNILRQTIKGGITSFQFREKGASSLSGSQRLEAARFAKELCRAHDVLFIVNDDLELMKEVDADGLHVGQTDGDLRKIRSETEGKILGISAHTIAETKDAVSHGADYIGIGPILQTTTKPDAQEPVGHSIFSGLRNQGVHIPLVGIGGIKLKETPEIIAAGADGVAVISALTDAFDPEMEAKRFKEVILKVKTGAIK